MSAKEDSHAAASPGGETPVAGPVSLGTALRVWAKIGVLGFGGPAGQIALMHRELVETRRWISEGRFLHALNYCMLLPGPEAQQLAVYVGWLMHRTLGGVIAGVLFVLPGALVLGALSWAYVAYGETRFVGAVFDGLKAAVVALVIEALLRIGKRALKTRFQLALAASAFLALALFDVPFPIVVLGAALIGLVANQVTPALLPATPAPTSSDDRGYVVDRLLSEGRAPLRPPSLARSGLRAATLCALWFAPVIACAALLGRDHILVQQGGFFSQSAVVTFGGAYAVLAYVAQRAVDDFGWLRPGEMVDGLALAETTPGPLILVLQFVGFVAAHRHPGGLDPMLAAVLGAAITSWVTFVPSFLFIFVGAPYIEAMRRSARLHAALSSVTAAVVGVILTLALWFGMHVVFGEVGSMRIGPLSLAWPDPATFQPVSFALAVLSAVALLRFRLGLGWLLLSAAGAGALFAPGMPPR